MQNTRMNTSGEHERLIDNEKFTTEEVLLMDSQDVSYLSNYTQQERKVGPMFALIRSSFLLAMMKYSAVRNGHMSCGTLCVFVMIHQNLVLSQPFSCCLSLVAVFFL
jgi:hypothetical protein